MSILHKTRFDTRLPKEQKELFEHAASIGGFRTLTEFIIFSAQEQARKIINNYNAILVSKRDQELFFNEVSNPKKPNDNLVKATRRYNKVLDSK